jgi:hypothetical protein
MLVMAPLYYYYGDLTQVALAAMTTLLAIVSANSFRKRPEGRYFLLMSAFVSLCFISVVTMVLELFVTGEAPVMIPFAETYLIPSAELIMVASFLGAVAWSPKVRKRLFPALLVGVIAVGLAVSAAYLAGPGGSSGRLSLPSDCTRPAGGFLIVASSMGYNDSVAHGAPIKTWPILDVGKGSNVSITVCNTYQQPIGFQVMHYLESQTEVVAPDHAITVSFLADQTGSFLIYCSVFSPIHIYLQGGEVRVV